ncbi:MAG: hypothetical protein KDI05_13080 [Halieaceae bacterium]|nr:hypothetical protein [Halieaceae bacterium]MCP5204851.1 hypothetical protein [Pseudomonadales bacterium]
MQQFTRSRLRRAVDELIIAEMFLVYATIESATAIGDGLSQLGRQLASGEEPGDNPADALRHTLRRVADEASEPYSSRFNYLRDRLRDN